MTDEPEVLNDHGTEEYRGRELHVQRVKSGGARHAEFELEVDGALVATASQIEEKGYTHPWAPALFRYGKALVDGLEATDD